MDMKLGQIEHRINTGIKFLKKTAKYKWQNYETKEDIYLIKISNSKTLKKIKTYRTKWVQHIRQMDRNRLPGFITKYLPWEKRSEGRPLQGLIDC